MTELVKSEKKKSKKREGGNWDGVWSQKNILKQLTFLRKIGYLYIEATGLLSRFINKHIKNNRLYSVIEMGCAGSSYLPYLQKKYNNLQIFGIDKSLKGCKLAAEGLDDNISSANVVCGDIFQNPLHSKQFDIVFSVGLIEHFDTPYKILEKHVELLKPGGMMICVVPNVVGLQGNFFRLKMWNTKNTSSKDSKNWIRGMKRITMEELETWFSEIGIKNVTVHPIGGIYPMLMLESYHPENQPFSVKLTFFIYRYFLFLPVIAINIPFLFRLNSLSFSPFIIAVGIKNNAKND